MHCPVGQATRCTGTSAETEQIRLRGGGAVRGRRDTRALWARYIENDFKLHLDEDPRVTRLGRLDARYAEEWSIRQDLSLLARTVPAVLRSQGVS